MYMEVLMAVEASTIVEESLCNGQKKVQGDQYHRIQVYISNAAFGSVKKTTIKKSYCILLLTVPSQAELKSMGLKECHSS